MLDAIHEVASSATPAQLAIAWALKRGSTVVVKAISEARLNEILNAGSITLESSEIEKLDKLNRYDRFFRRKGKPVLL